MLYHSHVLLSAFSYCVEHRNAVHMLLLTADGYAMSFDTPRHNHCCHVYICRSNNTIYVHLEASSALAKHIHKMNNKLVQTSEGSKIFPHLQKHLQRHYLMV